MEELQRKLSEMQHEMIMWKARAESMEEFSEGLKTQKEILDRLVEERDQLKEEVHEKSDRNRRMEQEMLAPRRCIFITPETMSTLWFDFQDNTFGIARR